MAPTATPSPTVAFEEVDLSAIKAHPDNVRHDIGDVTDLAASIKEKGLLEPLVLVPPHEHLNERAMGKATWLLLAGHRRLAALKIAKVKTAPAVIRADLSSRSAQIEAMVVENQHRADLTPVEEGEALQLLLDIDPKATQAQLAQRTGLPKKRVSERLRIARLDGPARDAVHAGQLTIGDALELAKLETRVPRLAEKVAVHIGTHNFAVHLERAKNAVAEAERVQHCRDVAQECGVTVVMTRPTDARYLSPHIAAHTKGLLEVEDDALTGGVAAIIRAHAQCPGAIVFIPHDADRLYEVDSYCTQWDEYHAPTTEERAEAETARQEAWEQERQKREQERLAAMTDEERAEHDRVQKRIEAERRAREERQEVLAAAAKVRHAHLAAAARKGDHNIALWCARQLATGYPEGPAQVGWRPVLGAPIERAVFGADDDTPLEPLRALVEQTLETADLNQAVIWAWISAQEWALDSLASGHYSADDLDDPGFAELVEALTAVFGYRWSDAEIESFGLDENGLVPTAADGVEDGDQ